MQNSFFDIFFSWGMNEITIYINIWLLNVYNWDTSLRLDVFIYNLIMLDVFSNWLTGRHGLDKMLLQLFMVYMVYLKAAMRSKYSCMYLQNTNGAPTASQFSPSPDIGFLSRHHLNGTTILSLLRFRLLGGFFFLIKVFLNHIYSLV